MAEPSAAKWVYRAAEARDLADTMRDPEARLALLEIAAGYQRFSEHAAAREQQNEPWLRKPPTS
jgi:hypothetical protein